MPENNTSEQDFADNYWLGKKEPFKRFFTPNYRFTNEVMMKKGRSFESTYDLKEKLSNVFGESKEALEKKGKKVVKLRGEVLELFLEEVLGEIAQSKKDVNTRLQTRFSGGGIEEKKLNLAFRLILEVRKDDKWMDGQVVKVATVFANSPEKNGGKIVREDIGSDKKELQGINVKNVISPFLSVKNFKDATESVLRKHGLEIGETKISFEEDELVLALSKSEGKKIKIVKKSKNKENYQKNFILVKTNFDDAVKNYRARVRNINKDDRARNIFGFGENRDVGKEKRRGFLQIATDDWKKAIFVANTSLDQELAGKESKTEKHEEYLKLSESIRQLNEKLKDVVDPLEVKRILEKGQSDLLRKKEILNSANKISQESIKPETQPKKVRKNEPKKVNKKTDEKSQADKDILTKEMLIGKQELKALIDTVVESKKEVDNLGESLDKRDENIYEPLSEVNLKYDRFEESLHSLLDYITITFGDSFDYDGKDKGLIETIDELRDPANYGKRGKLLNKFEKLIHAKLNALLSKP